MVLIKNWPFFHLSFSKYRPRNCVLQCVYLSASRFSMAWEKGIQVPFPFFVFAWHWKTNLNFAFCFSFSPNFEKRFCTSYFVFRFRIEKRIWILFFVFRFCISLKKNDKHNSNLFFNNKHSTKTKFKSVFQSDAKTKIEKWNSNPFFKVKRKRKTESKIQICFSMSCGNEKCKWHLNSIFPCHRKTVGTKVHAFFAIF